MNRFVFVQNIKKLCETKGIKPTVACRESGVSSSFINNIEKKGQVPSVENVQKLATYLGVTVSDLLGETAPIVSNSDTRQEMPIDALWNQLNPAGQAVLLDYADTLVSSGKYAIKMTQAAAFGGGRKDISENAARKLIQNMKEDDTEL